MKSKNIIVVQNVFDDLSKTSQSIESIRFAAHRWECDFYEMSYFKNPDSPCIFLWDRIWAMENFKNFDNTIYIEGEKDYIELYLMSRCDNNIISNSSFSWWGAWLNEKENKTVIGPKKWFGSEITHNTGDVLPENWIKI